MPDGLTGPELLAKVKELGDYANKSQLVRATGYVSTDKDGKERLNFTAFYEALLAAKGVELVSKPKPAQRRQRPLSFKTTVLDGGHVVVGARYFEFIEVEPGTKLRISIGRGKRLTLQPIQEKPAPALAAAPEAAGALPASVG